MECPKCKSLLRIGKSYMTFKNDDTPDQTTEAFTNLPMLCVNKECSMFAGENLSDPKQIVQTVTHKVN